MSLLRRFASRRLSLRILPSLRSSHRSSASIRWSSSSASSPSASSLIVPTHDAADPASSLIVPTHDATDPAVTIPDVVNTSLDMSMESVVDNSLHWYNYGAHYLQDMVLAIHDGIGLEWWAAIAASTIITRLALSPLAVPQLKASSRLAVIRPEMLKLQAAYQAKRNPTTEDVREQQAKTWALFSKYQASPFAGLKYAFLQMPVFLSFYWALRDLHVRFPAHFSDGGGGMLWFNDITAADPSMALPVLSAATFLLTMELGTEGATLDPKMKKVFRGMALLMVPLTYKFPAAVFMYWITNSIYAIAQVKFLRVPAVRRLFGILDPNDPNALHQLEMQLRPPQISSGSNYSNAVAGGAGRRRSQNRPSSRGRST